MTNEEAAKACTEIYNEFWLKYRVRVLGRQDVTVWDRIHSHYSVLYKKYPFPLARDMLRDFLNELEERMREYEKK